MPASSIYSTSGGSKATDLAIQVARDIANREVSSGLRNGTINQSDPNQIRQEYNRIYQQEYYKWYSVFQSQVEPLFDSPSPNKKFHLKHKVVRFSRQNQIILVNSGTITVSKFKYPIDDKDLSPETGDAYLSTWPGPLDWLYFNSQDKYKITDYISTLSQQDSARCIKYSDNVDGQRGVILKILEELLNRNGRIDGPGITRILLRKDEYQIRPDDNDLDVIQKNLLLGKREGAARFAESKYLWDHAMFLSFLDNSQPLKNMSFTPPGDGSFAKVLEGFTNSVDHKTLKTVYQSLLYQNVQTGSVKPRVENDPHMFAILNANDCDMDFDPNNEIFKLIIASKGSSPDENHLIKLGDARLETFDLIDDISNRSHTSFSQSDTYAKRTLMISNIDMLILNEIWEYCLNLAKAEDNYIYIINLIPYKLMFAARLLEYGEKYDDMFAYYLDSLRNAMVRVHEFPIEGDPFYDWNEIGRCVEYLGRVWEIYKRLPPTQLEPSPPPSISLKSKPISQHPPLDFNPEPTQESLQSDFPSPYQLDNSRPSFRQDVPDFNPPEITQPVESLHSFAEQTSTEAPFYAPPPPNIDESNVSRNSTANIPTSPIQPLSPPSMNDSDISTSPIRRNSSHQQQSPSQSQQQPQQQVNNSQLSQTFSLGKIGESLRTFLPKSNSIEMKLPDDRNKVIIYDKEKSRWHNTADPNDDDIDAMDGPPPVMNTPKLNQPNNQWTSTKSAKYRYPTHSFN